MRACATACSDDIDLRGGGRASVIATDGELATPIAEHRMVEQRRAARTVASPAGRVELDSRAAHGLIVAGNQAGKWCALRRCLRGDRRGRRARAACECNGKDQGKEAQSTAKRGADHQQVSAWALTKLRARRSKLRQDYTPVGPKANGQAEALWMQKLSHESINKGLDKQVC